MLAPVVTLALLGGVGGCDSESSATTTAGDVLVEPDAVKGAGVVRGSVAFGGMPPEPQVIRNEPCHDGAGPIYDETVVVNDDGTLRNVFVWVEGDLPKVSGANRPPAVLDQKDCRYNPHALAVQIRQPLTVRSSDPTLHNVHYDPQHNPPANMGFTAAGSERQVTFDAHEIVRTKCDVHPWMTAYIGVFDNPFFALTGDDGQFEITGLPPGQYTLIAWHEQFGRQEQPITIGDGDAPEPVEATFEYRP